MASTQSSLFTLFLRLINKKNFLRRLMATDSVNRFSTPAPPARLLKAFEVNRSAVNGHPVFTLKPRAGSGKKHILYLHGGAYVQSFTLPHWSFISALIKATHSTIIAPDYPLAPAYTYEASFAMVLPLYRELLATVDPSEVILMGDSSGGGFALALAQLLLKENIPQPGQLILLSPWLDISLSNQEIQDIAPSDPFLGIEGLLQAGKAYAGEAPVDQYLLSPIYGPLKGLAKTSVFAGSNEILVADARKLKKLAETAGMDLNYYEYTNMMHAWMLFNFPESKTARQQIFGLIQAEEANTGQ